jgi:lipoyl-dependent peroxiredoxin
MAVRTAESIWEGTLKEGKGTMKFGSKAYEGSYTFASRFEEGDGTNPEELIGAAHSGCYSMFLSAVLTKEGFKPKKVRTTAKVSLGTVDGAPKITKIELDCEAQVPELDDAKFQEVAEISKKGCPVSKALAGTEIVLQARLIK